MGDLEALGAPSAGDVDWTSYLELDDLELDDPDLERRLRRGCGYDRDSEGLSEKGVPHGLMKIFPAHPIANISSNAEEKYTLSTVCDAFLVMCTEVRPDCSWNQGEFQSIVEGCHRPTASAPAEASFCPASSPADSTAVGPPPEADAPGHAMRIAHAHMELYLPTAEYEVVLTVLRALRRGEMTKLRAQQLVEAVLAEHPALHAQFVSALRAEGGSHVGSDRGLEGFT
jgi:hypothetical protein